MEMSEKKTVDNLLEIAQKMANEKFAQEKQRVEERINDELGDVRKAVEMVRSGLCYKKIDEFGRKRYLFVTEETLIQDYLSEPKNTYVNKGIRFNVDGSKTSYIFTVNGIYYYDMRYILNAYEEDVRKEQKRITGYSTTLNELINEFERLLEERKAIRKMLDDWTARQEEGGEAG